MSNLFGNHIVGFFVSWHVFSSDIKGHKVQRLDGTIRDTYEREQRIKNFQTDMSYTVFLLTTQVLYLRMEIQNFIFHWMIKNKDFFNVRALKLLSNVMHYPVKTINLNFNS